MATGRREVLLRGGTALLGAAAGVAAVSARSPLPVRAAARQGAPTKTLYGRGWRITSRDFRKGELPTEGVRQLIRGELFDAPTGGARVAEFFATAHRLGTLGKTAPQAPGSLELHTLVFPDGTLVGSGIASAAAASEGEFAIIGGTGRYLGARGAYRAQQNHRELGGNGTALLTLTLI